MPSIVRKTADEIVNNSTVQQNDDELFLAMGANEIWIFELTLFYISSGAANIDFGLALPAGASFIAGEYNDAVNAVITAAGEFPGGTTGDGANEITMIRALVENGVTPGNFQLQWAQRTAQVFDTKVLEGSHLFAWRV